jgi:maltooligosyltrehalose trehalohydrolase
LRLDAIEAIFDHSARTFLEELAARTSDLSRRLGRQLILTAESDRNDPRIIRSAVSGGYGIDAQWCDDFHHSLHTLLTGERRGYYVDFGGLGKMVKSIKEAYVYQGEYSVFRGRRHGAPPTGCGPEQFIVFSQNHDQVGNRLRGTRLSGLVSFEAAKLAAACVLLSPFVPMLFMGEEYAETSPFLFFVDHPSEQLREAVRQGRKKAMEAFDWSEDPDDPSDPETFRKSKIAWEKRESGGSGVMLRYYKELLSLRGSQPALVEPGGLLDSGVTDDARAVYMLRVRKRNEVLVALNFSDSKVDTVLPMAGKRWKKVLDSSDACWEGPGSLVPDRIDQSQQVSLNPYSAVLLVSISQQDR